MKALQYRKSIPRYGMLKLLSKLGPRGRSLCTGAVSPVALRDISPSNLPTQQWVRVAPHLTGVCGSDLATICAKGSPYLAPITSMPFVMGHEVVGTVIETGRDVTRVAEGDRVVLHPALGCEVRGISPPCDACSQGRDALCRNVLRGDISSGIQTGYCRDTGGGFSEQFVAHQSQLYKIPESLDDVAAVLIEPFACAVHGALRAEVGDSDCVLVIGCGAIGLLTIAALRGLGCSAQIVAIARHDHQREHAKRLGANEVIESPRSVASRFSAWAKALDAEVLDPELGKPAVIGGAGVTFDCVGTPQSIDDGLRFTRGGGTFVLVGMPGAPAAIDWTPLWFKELTVRAAYAYGPERRPDGVRDTFEIAIDLMQSLGPKLTPLVGSPFELGDYQAALRSALNTGTSGVVKTIIAPNHGD